MTEQRENKVERRTGAEELCKANEKEEVELCIRNVEIKNKCKISTGYLPTQMRTERKAYIMYHFWPL